MSERGPVVVSGASGLLGTALCQSLEQEGYLVVRLVRPGSAASPGRSTIAWNPAAGEIDRDGLQALGPITAIVHLAGAGIADARWTPERRNELVDSRIRSTELLRSTIDALDAPPGCWLSGSAIGIYGDRGDETLTEAATPGTGFLAELCQRWEAASTGLAVRTAQLRTGIVLTQRGGALKKQLPLFRAGLGGRSATGRQWMSWITLEDWVRAVTALLGPLPLAGPINLTAPGAVRNGEFAHSLGAALHRPAVLPVPATALRLALGRELVDEVLLASQRVCSDPLGTAGFTFHAADLSTGLAQVLG